MKNGRIKRGMVLAAGRGERLRPLTDTLPKPLVQVAGQCLLDRILDRLAEYGVEETVLNLHHLGGQIADHLAERSAPPWQTVQEKELLETGGGVKNALPHLGPAAFFVINGDVLWRDGPRSCLARLAEQWDGRRMDGLLLLQPAARAFGYDGLGDFFLDQEGFLRRRRETEIAPYVFAGVQILHPRLFRDAPEGAFSLNLLYDQAIEAGRLRGMVHSGDWYHVGTLDALARAEEALADQRLDLFGS